MVGGAAVGVGGGGLVARVAGEVEAVHEAVADVTGSAGRRSVVRGVGGGGRPTGHRRERGSGAGQGTIRGWGQCRAFVRRAALTTEGR